MTVNNSLDTIAQRIEQEIGSSQTKNGRRDINGDDIKIEHQKQVVRNSDKKESKKRPGSREKIVHLDKAYNSSAIKNKILNLLKETSRPISYHEIAETLSQDFRNQDFNYILRELDQLEKKGDIIGQVAAGKLYFQIKD